MMLDNGCEEKDYNSTHLYTHTKTRTQFHPFSGISSIFSWEASWGVSMVEGRAEVVPRERTSDFFHK